MTMSTTSTTLDYERTIISRGSRPSVIEDVPIVDQYKGNSVGSTPETYHFSSSNPAEPSILSIKIHQENATQASLQQIYITERQKSQNLAPLFPVLDKHDIPVVAGVSISLLLIFISMGVYSFIKKRENSDSKCDSFGKSPQSRRKTRSLALQGNYENKAFEDESSVDAVQQNPYETHSLSSSRLSNLITHAGVMTGGHEGHLISVEDSTTQTSPAKCKSSESGEESKLEGNDRIMQNNNLPIVPGASASTSSTEHNAQSIQYQDGAIKKSQNTLAQDPVCSTSCFHGPEKTIHNTPSRERRIDLSHCQTISSPVVVPENLSYGIKNNQGITTVAVDIHLYSCIPETSTVAMPTINTVASFHHVESNLQIRTPEHNQQDPSVQCEPRNLL
uniref:Uncharacterized protein LOC117367453 n=1 Tax=Geotrypetes seraphini TaxID=260995 RepID=A0A6P8SC91_GEOSA|nr:uncharacterized protein LOC117367453 [Geotrypetes seraphini]